jgi:hypothetical protein
VAKTTQTDRMIAPKLEINMKKYIIIYTVSNLLLTIIAIKLSSLLAIDTSTTLNAAVTIGASFVAARWFTNDHVRIPSQSEATSFARLALISSWLVSILLVYVVLSASALDMIKALASNLGLVLTLMISLIISLVYYFVIKWAFAWYAKQSIQRLH